MRHGQRSEMKDFRSADYFLRQFFFRQHHVRARIAVKREVPVSIRIRMHQCQRCVHLVIL